jgi:hypothetical protein
MKIDMLCYSGPYKTSATSFSLTKTTDVWKYFSFSERLVVLALEMREFGMMAMFPRIDSSFVTFDSMAMTLPIIGPWCVEMEMQSPGLKSLSNLNQSPD